MTRSDCAEPVFLISAAANMNRRIIEIDAEIARLRSELAETQSRIQGLAEERGRELATLEDDTSFLRKAKQTHNGSRMNGTHQRG